MAISQPSALIRYLCKFVFAQAEGTDGQLLTGFIERRDEVAFDTLVRRHGPMVLGVCQRILRNEHDAEDAFQATFLVLVRKAASVVPREMVGNWLYGVAHNTALKAKAVGMKRRGRERQMADLPEPGSVGRSPDLWDDLKPVLDQELSRLPDKYRVPIVLCDLEGKSHQEAARQLGWPQGTLSGRLSRARALLAKRLTRHGPAISVATLAAAFSQNATSASLPTPLASSTVKAAMLYAAGQAALTTMVSPKVASLTEGVLKAMLLSKFVIATSVLALVVIGAGASLLGYRTQAAGETPQGKALEQEADASNARHKSKTNEDLMLRSKSGESKVRQLQKERLAALKEIAAEIKRLFNQGQTSVNMMLQADSAALKAELELCEHDVERVPVHEKLVANARELEGFDEQRFKAGRIPHSELLTAKVNRLEAEIDLERAKAKVASQMRPK